MNGLTAVDRLDMRRALHGLQTPDQVEALRHQLANAADFIAATLTDAANRPTPERMERVMRDASGIAAVAGRLRAVLIDEGAADERC